MSGPIRRKTAEPRSVLDRAYSHRLFYERTLAITSCVLGCDHFQLFLQLPACPAVAKVRSLSQDGYGYNYLGQTETPRREEWSVSSFSRCCCATSQCQHVKGHPFPVPRVDYFVYRLQRLCGNTECPETFRQVKDYVFW